MDELPYLINLKALSESIPLPSPGKLCGRKNWPREYSLLQLKQLGEKGCGEQSYQQDKFPLLSFHFLSLQYLTTRIESTACCTSTIVTRRIEKTKLTARRLLSLVVPQHSIFTVSNQLINVAEQQYGRNSKHHR